MTLATDSLIAGRVALLDHVGIAATYHDDAIVTPVALAILIAAEADQQTLLTADQVERQMVTLTIVHTVVTAPKREGVVTVASGQWAGTWRITRVRPITGGGHDCLAERVEARAPLAPRAGPMRPLELGT